ncbi:MAG: hypothetical protein ABTQ34_09510 [Bdellovibrionales bacterium]
MLPCVLALGITLPATAANITVEMLGSQSGSWTSNPLLVVEGAKPLIGSTTSPEIIIRDTAPAMDTSIDFRIDQNIFNQASFNSTDAHATAQIDISGERWNFILQQRADYDTTRTSEQTSIGSESGAKRHLGLSLSPKLSYSISPVDSLELGGAWSISRYQANNYTDYKIISASIGWSRKIDTLNTAILKVTAQRYKTTEGSGVTNDTIGPSLGWKTQITPQLDASIAVGLQEAKERRAGVPNKAWKLQYTFSGNLSFRGEQDTVILAGSRNQYPYGNGSEALQTALSLNETHAINPLFSLVSGISWQLSDYTTPQTGDTRTLTSANAGARYKITQDISAALTYQYRIKTIVNSSQTAQDNSVLFTLVYRPGPLATP